MTDVSKNREYRISLISYLSLFLNKLITYSSILTRWRPDNLSYERVFDRQALPMIWDYGEKNPFIEDKNSLYYQNSIETLSWLSKLSNFANVSNFSATSLPYDDNYFDAIFTDPPYYDNIMYSELSDFFYVWLKRSIGDLYPELFSTPLTPRSQEIVVNPVRHGNTKTSKEFFEKNIYNAFKEMNRVLKTNGILLVVYTHKSTLDAGFVVTATWPIDTEMKSRLNAKNTASLASSIYIVARKVEKEELGWFEEIKNEIKDHLEKKLDRLWKERL
ncbi:MAG: hypothetical protein RMI01_08600 [Thermodesulfovibrio sp.]|nr:hypothetical protein [Thermodesulfovibrio sp.]